MADDDQDQDRARDETGPPLSREEALARLRAIRAELAAMPREPPQGRRRRSPPPPRRRHRPPGASERPEPPEPPQEPEIGPL